MARISLTGLSDNEKELLREAADEVGMGLSEYCRTRLRAGHQLWTAGGDFDIFEMQKRLGDDLDQSAKEPSSTPTESATAAEHDRFIETIKRNLPTDEQDAISKKELEEIVRSEVLGEALQDLLNEDEAKYLPTAEGYILTESKENL